MEYATIFVPGCETSRSSTLARLEAFKNAGGRLIFLGEAPKRCNAVPSERGKALYDISENCDYTRSAIITALESDKVVNLRGADGILTDYLIYQLRQDVDCKWLFVAHSEEPYNSHIDRGDDVRITVKGEYGVIVYDTQNGNIYPADFTFKNGNTIISQHIYGYDSFLYKLVDKNAVEPQKQKIYFRTDASEIKGLVDYELSEDNVLVLDMAEHKLQGEEEFSPTEEILRLDNICRRKLSLIERGGADVQPWVYGEKAPVTKVTLRYTINSEIDYEGAVLALEDAEKAEILFNGEKVDNSILGNYVDISIFKVALPKICKGENELIITYPFGDSTNLESVFILGKFGVKLNGTQAVIATLPEKLGFGNILSQGLPFYGGNITYKLPVQVKDNKLSVVASDFMGTLISAKLDGKEIGKIAYPPYLAQAEGLENGNHTLELTLYGHRYNTFGPLHLVNEKESWHGPGAWRSTGFNWSYEYVLRKIGLMKAPVIE